MPWAGVVGLLGGLVVLVVGAEALVRGASRLAGLARISPLVIGLTVVAFGTSAPELAVSVGGALRGASGLAVGNVVGSNVFNVLAILGVAAVAAPLVVEQRLVRIDVPLLVGVTALAWGLAADGRLARAEGVLLVAGLVAYTVWSYLIGRRQAPHAPREQDGSHGATNPVSRRVGPLALLGVLAGLAALVGGAELLVGAATRLAAAAVVPDVVLGATVVAAGTSLPELATSVVAARRGERDIAVGNVVGSNLFNLLGVLGATSLVAAGGLPVSRDVLVGDLPVALLAVLVVLPVLASGLVLQRWEGGLLLAGYAGYVAVLLLLALGSPHVAEARAALLGGLGVLAVFVGAVALRQVRRTP